MAFEILDHELLSDTAAALDPAVLDAYAAAGADMLNLSGLDEQDERVLRALVFQVNLLVELDPLHGVRQQSRRGGRLDVTDNKAPPLAIAALAILNAIDGWAGIAGDSSVLDGADWTTLRSLRRVQAT